jgi:hypothetical protein
VQTLAQIRRRLIALRFRLRTSQISTSKHAVFPAATPARVCCACRGLRGSSCPVIRLLLSRRLLDNLSMLIGCSGLGKMSRSIDCNQVSHLLFDKVMCADSLLRADNLLSVDKLLCTDQDRFGRDQLLEVKPIGTLCIDVVPHKDMYRRKIKLWNRPLHRLLQRRHRN